MCCIPFIHVQDCQKGKFSNWLILYDLFSTVVCQPWLKENDVNYPILQVVKYFFKVGNLIVINSGKLGMCNFESFGWWEANAAFYTYLNSQNKSLNNGAVFGEGKVSDVHCTRANELSCWATKGLSRAACFTTFNKKTHAIKLNLMRFNQG